MNGVARAVGLIALILIIGILVVFPWINGGADTRPQVIFLGLTTLAIGVALVASLLSKEFRPKIPTSLLVLLCGLIVGGLQLLPMSDSFWGAIGNKSVELRQEMTSSSGLILEGSAQEASPLSLYPTSTKHDLAMLIAGIAFFLFGVQFLSRSNPFKVLMLLMAVNGALLACFGIVQQITWNGQLYWSMSVPQGGTPFASFIYHNQAASIFAFCLAASIGYLVEIFSRSLSTTRYSDNSMREYSRADRRTIFDTIQYFIADLNGERLLAFSLLLLNLSGLLLSLSRGAFLSFFAAGILIWTLVSFQRKQSSWINIFLFGGLLVGLFTWISMSEGVSSRLQTLLNSEAIEQESRLPHWEDTWGAVQDYGVYGTGIGTYRYVYHQYQDHVNEGWFLHAHNQYLEALVDAGIFGLTLMLAMIFLVGYACWKLFKSDYYYSFPFAVVGSLVLLFQVFHAGVDYCLYLPATMITFALLVGSFVGRMVRALDGQNLLIALPKTEWAWPVILLMLMGGTYWSYGQIKTLAEMETVLETIPFETDLSTLEPHQFRIAIADLTDVLEERPGDAEGEEALAELYLSLYRLEARERLSKELNVSLKDQNLWEWTSPIVLADVSFTAHKNQEFTRIKELKEQAVVQEFLKPTVEHLKLSLKSCPLLSRVHFRLYQLGFMDENWKYSDAHLHKAEQFGSWNAGLMYLSGQMRFARGEQELALKDWRQSLKIDPRHLNDIVRYCNATMTPQKMIDEVIPDSPEILILLAEQLYKNQPEAQVVLFERITQLLETNDYQPGASDYYRAKLATLRGEKAEAIELYQLATARNPSQLDWNYEFARLLREENQLVEAERILNRCVRQAPQRAKFSNMLKAIRKQRKQQSTPPTPRT